MDAVVAPQRPKIVTHYTDYEPPFDVAPIIERMLESVPPKYLVGLSEVVLTNTAGLPRKLRRSMTKNRGRKRKQSAARGLYYQEWNNRPAWIQIYVDNTLRGWEKGWWLKFRFVQEATLEDVLFHEIGHHIHFSVRPEYRETEDVADVWKVRLRRFYNRRRHWCLRAILFPFMPLIEMWSRSLDKRSFEKGWISRAELEEKAGRRGDTRR